MVASRRLGLPVGRGIAPYNSERQQAVQKGVFAKRSHFLGSQCISIYLRERYLGWTGQFFAMASFCKTKPNWGGERTQIAVSGVRQMGSVDRACQSTMGRPILLRLFSIPHHCCALPEAGEKSL
jgi:hypothetical protein